MRNDYVLKWLVCIFLLMTSCTIEENNTSGFFDSKSYFSAIADSLNDTKSMLEKTMVSNGASETIIDSLPNWKNELLPFMELDITKPAMKSSYEVDSSNGSPGVRIEYKAVDEYVSIRNMVVTKDSIGKVVSLYATVRSKNPYHSSADTLQFQNGVGYRISALSEPYIGSKIQFSLSGKFINP